MPYKRILAPLFAAFLSTVLIAGQVLAAPGGSNKPASAQDSAVRGVAGDLWADIVIGKPRFGEMTINDVTAERVFNPGGVIVDRSVEPNRIYVYDGGNSRVLGMHVGSQSGQSAELVLGQPDVNGYAACNGDGNYQNYPDRAPASASSMCSMPEFQVSPREGGAFANMAVDSAGGLYVPDFDNHRVLFYTSPFDTDTVADDAWGQADFSGNECNRGQGTGSPDATSLCLRSPGNEGFVGGVGLDSANNLWVTDNQNNRVLRFPYDSNTGRAGHTADLVLGQPDFGTSWPWDAMDKMWAPAAVRVEAATGKVYVADSLNNRILVFSPPFTDGMSAGGTLGSGLRLPTSVEFDLAGNIWVSDSGNNQLLRFTPAGVLDRMLFRNTPDYSGFCGGWTAPRDGTDFYFPGPDIFQDSINICDSRGSLGIDSDGNIWASGSNFVQDVWRYPAPFPALGTAHAADVQLFKPYTLGELNDVTENALSDPRGIAIGAGQLIISDGGRVLFWNDAPASLTNGKPADGLIVAPNFNQPVHPATGSLRVDDQDRLWFSQGDKIKVYQLPLTNGEMPFYTLQPPVALKGGGGSIGWNANLDVADFVITSGADYLWLSDPDNHRVLRIANPLTSPNVDIVLGQLNASGHQCNQGHGTPFSQQPGANRLCFPGGLGLDPDGNLFVSDNALEDHGNNRMLEFDAGLFPASPATTLYGIPASQVYGTGGSFSMPGCFSDPDTLCKPLEPAFGPDGQMVVGLNGYTGTHFPLVYQDPLTNLLPVDTLKDYYSMPSAATYDEDGNLYVADRNRARVLVYLGNPVHSHAISGNAGAAGVTLSYIDVTEKTVQTNSNGNYTLRVSDDWSGTVTPSKAGVIFTPASREYTHVLARQTGQNYTATQTFLSSAGQDGWVLESGDGSGVGGSMNSGATTFRLGDDAARKQYRGILSFNTGAALPDKAVITAITLRLRKSAVVGGGNPVTAFQGFMIDIKTGLFGVPALQTSDFKAAASKTYGPFSPGPASGWYSINLTGAKAYINKLAINGGLTQMRLRFKLDNNNNIFANHLSLYSGNAPAASRPQLVITYYVP